MYHSGRTHRVSNIALLPDQTGNALEESAENEEYMDNRGVAMMAWSEGQFEYTASQCASDIKKALLECFELHTLVMVMLVEGYREILILNQKNQDGNKTTARQARKLDCYCCCNNVTCFFRFYFIQARV